MKLRIGTWNCFGQGQGFDALLALRAPHDHRFEDEAVLTGMLRARRPLHAGDSLALAQRLFDKLDASALRLALS